MRVVREPSPALASFVASLWYFEGDLPHRRELILPTGAMQLLVNLHEDETRAYEADGHRVVARTRGAALCGAFARPFGIDTAEQRRIVGVTFRPGGAYPFLAVAASEVSEAHVDLGDLWGRDGSLLRERLLEMPNPRAALAELEAVLLARAVRPLAEDGAVRLAIAALGRGARVGEVVERTGIAPRRFIAQFAERVGLTPKRYARVRRFQRVLASLVPGQAVDWADVAASCGYFDQAHLIHDFRSFSGLRPTAYRPRAADELNHVPVEP
jgi:AraC-like DNA-binding protein